MNKREAKRRAARLLADVARREAVTAFRGFDAADARRLIEAVGELADELERRGSGEQGHTDEPDPAQLSLMRNPCCDDTGFADYAAVPCPNPTCTAVLRQLRAAGQPISDEGQRLLSIEDAADADVLNSTAFEHVANAIMEAVPIRPI